MMPTLSTLEGNEGCCHGAIFVVTGGGPCANWGKGLLLRCQICRHCCDNPCVSVREIFLRGGGGSHQAHNHTSAFAICCSLLDSKCVNMICKHPIVPGNGSIICQWRYVWYTRPQSSSCWVLMTNLWNVFAILLWIKHSFIYFVPFLFQPNHPQRLSLPQVSFQITAAVGYGKWYYYNTWWRT